MIKSVYKVVLKGKGSLLKNWFIYSFLEKHGLKKKKNPTGNLSSPYKTKFSRVSKPLEVISTFLFFLHAKYNSKAVIRVVAQLQLYHLKLPQVLKLLEWVVIPCASLQSNCHARLRKPNQASPVKPYQGWQPPFEHGAASHGNPQIGRSGKFKQRVEIGTLKIKRHL